MPPPQNRTHMTESVILSWDLSKTATNLALLNPLFLSLYKYQTVFSQATQRVSVMALLGLYQG